MKIRLKKGILITVLSLYVCFVWYLNTDIPKQINYMEIVYEDFKKENKSIIFTYDPESLKHSHFTKVDLLELKITTFDRSIYSMSEIMSEYDNKNLSTHYWSMVWLYWYDYTQRKFDFEHRFTQIDVEGKKVIVNHFYNDHITCQTNRYFLRCLKNE